MGNLWNALLARFGFGEQARKVRENISSVNAAAFADGVATRRVQILDVRTTEEYTLGHIEGAVHVDVQHTNFGAHVRQLLDPALPVYVYCRSGKRSLTAAYILARAGYRVVNLAGGIMEWAAAGRPIVR